MRIIKNAWFVRFARAQVIWNAVLLEAVQRLEDGPADADLGGVWLVR
ncbi:MAG: type II toxin-antitoxin system RelE/ParE family toxin [Chloroflexi bacterium]|nr:type II toxin-antitoxin system RelE/ParE family toxin [Chloroflexota bacterium]